jgi:purine nucleoside phosphorylase
MTIASECAVARELGLAYAAICVVDNMAAGVGAADLTVDEFEAGKRANRERLLDALARVIPRLAA